MQYDLAVVGGGPGGYVAAIRAAQLGARVALIEERELGGTCLNRGCVPTKTLLASAAKWRELQNCQEFGLSVAGASFDFSAVMARKEKVVKQLRDGIAGLLKSYSVEVLPGQASLTADRKIRINAPGEEKTIQAGKVILATGSRPARLPISGMDLPGVLDSDQLLALDKLPASVVIVGGGVVGLEMAVILQSFGCQVTVVELLPGILAGMDRDIVNRLSLLLKKQGIKILTAAKVNGVALANGGSLSVLVESGKGEETLLAEKVLVAAGRSPVLDGLGLEAAGIAFDRKGIAVDEKMQSNIAGIYAIGDVTGKSLLAHAASSAGIVAAENALGQSAAMCFDNIPACIFTIPEVASVGITEQQAVAEGREIAVGKMNFAGNCKALSLGETDGFVKIIAAKDSQEVLGVHIMGPHASDLIMEGAVAVANRLTAGQLANTVHPHPTLSEAVMECAHGVFGEPIHQVRINRK